MLPMPVIRHAFVLGAGLGTRLRPLTDTLPKPMVPLWNKPLLTYAFDHLIADAGTESFLVNTHHCAGAYATAFPEGCYRGRPVAFRHEPVLLDTAGGIDNVRDWLPADESFLVYNGDILTDLPLAPAIGAHERSGALVTMVLRSGGDLPNVAWDSATGKVRDMRDALGTAPKLPRYQFTGLYLVRSGFLRFLVPGRIESVVMAFLRAIQAGERISGVLIDEGHWSDLGNRSGYLAASAMLGEDAAFPRYGRAADCIRVSPGVEIAPSAWVDALSSVGGGCRIGDGATVEACILWPGSRVEPGARLTRCIVRTAQTAGGAAVDRDF